MAKNFKNGAVVRNERGEYLATRDGVNWFWANGTEHAICFTDNNDAEEKLNQWNRNHPTSIISGVRIEESTCMCGETERPVSTTSGNVDAENNYSWNDCGCNDDDDVDEKTLDLAIDIMKNGKHNVSRMVELSEQQSELEEELADVNARKIELQNQINSIKRELNSFKNDVRSKLGTIFSARVVDKLMAQLLK